jgi:hypothetical protein
MSLSAQWISEEMCTRWCSKHLSAHDQMVKSLATPFLMLNGYPHVSLGGVKKRRYLHNLVLEAFVGPRPKGQVTRHLDGDKTNNTLSNLQYGTVSENMADRVMHGGGNQGSRHPLSKLTEAQIRSIRARYKPWKVTLKMLGEEYGVSSTNIKQIVTGMAWKHVPCYFESSRVSRLSESQIRTIRKRYVARSVPERYLAREYGVTRWRIRQILGRPRRRDEAAVRDAVSLSIGP